MPSHIFLARNRDFDPSDFSWNSRLPHPAVVIGEGQRLDALGDIICDQRRPGAPNPRLNAAGDPADRSGVEWITRPCGVRWVECIDHLIGDMISIEVSLEGHRRGGKCGNATRWRGWGRTVGIRWGVPRHPQLAGHTLKDHANVLLHIRLSRP